MTTDSSFRKVLGTMDAKGMRGVLSRGKPIYGGNRVHPKMGKIPEGQSKYSMAILKRFEDAKRTYSK